MSNHYNQHATRTTRMSSENPNPSNQPAEEVGTIRRSALPTMFRVISSNIWSMGYDDPNKMMYVLFGKDAEFVYRYPQIDKEQFLSVYKAESIGKALGTVKAAAASDPALAHEKLKLIGDGVSVVESSP